MTNPNSDQSPRIPQTEEFLRLLGKHERRMMAMVLAMVNDWGVAEDICQEVRVRLWQQFDKYDRSRDFGAWCRTIAYYEVLTYREKSQRQPHIFNDELLSAVAQEFNGLPDDHAQRLQALGKCLSKVSETNRNILLRYYRRQESLREIAESLRRSFDATRQLILRTRKSLARCVEQTLKQDFAGDETF